MKFFHQTPMDTPGPSRANHSCRLCSGSVAIGDMPLESRMLRPSSPPGDGFERGKSLVGYAYYENITRVPDRPRQPIATLCVSRQYRRQEGLMMPKYFFHLAGELPAQDLLGHECANDMEARDHGSFIAHRIGTEKPGMVRKGNFISVRDEHDKEIAQVPLASTSV